MRIRTEPFAALVIGTSAILAATAICSPGGALPYTEGFSATICRAPRAGTQVTRAADTAAALTDGEIAYLYIQANLFEVELAELGKSVGTSDDVKQHGNMVAKDHRGVIKRFEELLHQNHIKPVATAASAAALTQHQAAVAALMARKGTEFDNAYLAHEASNHRAVIDALRTILLPAVKNEAIAAHMHDMLPAFEHHLAVTLDAAKRVGKPTSTD